MAYRPGLRAPPSHAKVVYSARPAEDYRRAAVREFVEETETLFFGSDLERAARTPPRIAEQLVIMEQRLEDGPYEKLQETSRTGMGRRRYPALSLRHSPRAALETGKTTGGSGRV